MHELLTIPASERGTPEVHEPLVQVRQPLKLAFHDVHRFLGQFDPGLICRGHHFDHGMVPFPGHGPGIRDHGVYSIKQGTIAMLF
jgi:hypothetical protein